MSNLTFNTVVEIVGNDVAQVRFPEGLFDSPPTLVVDALDRGGHSTEGVAVYFTRPTADGVTVGYWSSDPDRVARKIRVQADGAK